MAFVDRRTVNAIYYYYYIIIHLPEDFDEIANKENFFLSCILPCCQRALQRGINFSITDFYDKYKSV